MRLSTTKYCIFSNSKKISPTNIFFFLKGFLIIIILTQLNFVFPLSRSHYTSKQLQMDWT